MFAEGWNSCQILFSRQETRISHLGQIWELSGEDRKLRQGTISSCLERLERMKPMGQGSAVMKGHGEGFGERVKRV